MKKGLSNNAKTIWIFIISIILVALAIIVWFFQVNSLSINADVYVPEATQTPAVSPSPPIPQPTVIVDTCQMKCEGKNYQTGTCREYPIIADPQICLNNETNIGVTDDCYVEEGILGSGKACCCGGSTVSPTPTASDQDVSSVTETTIPPTVLISTGASLWFNLTIAVMLAFGIGYFMFRDEIWGKKK